MPVGRVERKGLRSQRWAQLISDLKAGVPIAVSLAPSFPAAFYPLPAHTVLPLLRAAGFLAVEETASVLPGIIEARRRLAQDGQAFYIANSCPQVVSLINKQYSYLKPYVFPGPSPMLAHAACLKARSGRGTRVLFIGPCAAKKKEAAMSSGLVDYAFTFREVRPWLAGNRVWIQREEGLGLALDPTLNPARRAVLAAAASGWRAVEAVLRQLPAHPPRLVPGTFGLPGRVPGRAGDVGRVGNGGAPGDGGTICHAHW